MEYNRYHKYHNEPVDGFILQGSVSDRQGYVDALGQKAVDDMVSLAKDMIDAGSGEEVVPKSKLPPTFFFPNPMTAYRLHSLAAVGCVILPPPLFRFFFGWCCCCPWFPSRGAKDCMFC